MIREGLLFMGWGAHHTRREGAKFFGQAVKGGDFFYSFSCFVGILGTFNFLVKGGGRKYLDASIFFNP